MRKLLALAVLTVAATSLVAANVRAEEGSGLEISGNITNVAGWQRGAKGTATGAAIAGNVGILNDGFLSPVNKTNQFGIMNDQVELDLAKSFGENIRARADLDFSAHNATLHPIAEQAYVTANIPAGNGWELLAGRFNSGIGLDPVDRNELSTVSYSLVHRTLLPHNLTGARLGYNFSDATRAELYVVNNLRDLNPMTAPAAGVSGDSALPGVGLNLVYSWGEEGNSSWVKLNAAGSPETSSSKGFSGLADLSASLAVNESLKVGLEGAYRQDGVEGAGNNDSRFFGGQAKGTYAFSDVWDGTLRYSIVHDRQGTGSSISANVLGLTGAGFGASPGNGGTIHQISLATGYSIADGARFVLEGNVDMSKARGAAAAPTSYAMGVAGMFAYSF